MKNAPLKIRIRFVLSFFFVFWFNLASAQQIPASPVDQQFFEEKCAATYIEQKQIDRMGIYATREYFEHWVEGKKRQIRRSPSQFRTQADEKRRIPVVVHVIHNGTPIDQEENIPFLQIENQIKILNRDYSRQNPDAIETPDEFLSVAAASNIEFVLAKQDPDGLPTNGVNRVLGTKNTYTPDDEALISQLALWPPEDYMNIWVVPLQPPYLGYSSFPISELPGLEFPPNTRETDGVTIDYKVFGEGGNALSSSVGRTATHEIGHFLGLRHIWGDGGCEVDDFVEDTPNQSAPNNTCPLPSPQFSCDSRDMTENFMDYTPDKCMNLFTAGQVERMDVVLNFSPRRTSLINGRATVAPKLAPNQLSLKEIIQPQDFLCAANISPEIAVLNVGNNKVTSATIEIILNGKRLERKSFKVNIETGATEILSFKNVALSTSSSNHFKVEIISVNGKTDFDLSHGVLESHPKIQPTVTLPYSFRKQDFSTLWTRKNDDQGITWEQTVLSIDGKQQELIYLNGYNYETQGELDYLISPQINLAAAPDAQLKFEMAFSPYTSMEFQESLLVAVSTDCGNTFELLESPYKKSGVYLETSEASTSEFFPDEERQFRTELVNLAAYAGEGSIRLAFISVNGYGNNIFLKNIEILASEEYLYDFKINKVVSPGPINDGSQETEVLQISNTGNLAISEFVVQKISYAYGEETFIIKDKTLKPGESGTYALSGSLEEGFNSVEYTISEPNFDQNPGNSSTIVRYFIQNDSSILVPWRQNFDNPDGLGPWIPLNPENDDPSWEIQPVEGEGDNQMLVLDRTSKGNSYWLGSPLFDLTKTAQASIFFDWAANGFESSDLTSLSLLISNDGGASYKELWRKDNKEMNTFSGNASAISSGDFKRQHVNISDYTGEGHESIRIAFKGEHKNGRSKPIYLDNIELFLSANPDPVDPGMGNTIIYPNPAFDNFNLTFDLKDYEDVKVQIISSTGQVVHEMNYPNTLNQTYTFNTSVFAKGVFIVRITSDKISATKKVIIQ